MGVKNRIKYLSVIHKLSDKVDEHNLIYIRIDYPSISETNILHYQSILNKCDTRLSHRYHILDIPLTLFKY